MTQWRKDTSAGCKCGGKWKAYNIGFDDGYQCQKCLRIIETYEYRQMLNEETRMVFHKYLLQYPPKYHLSDDLPGSF